MASSSSLTILIALCLFMASIKTSNSQLTTNCYSNSCPNLFDTVQYIVQSAVQKEARLGASLLRLFFHDCFVNGCDGSVLLDDTSTFTGEKHAKPNNNSLRGFEVIDQIKSAVEKVCPGIVSCADILAITARDSVVALGGPSWDVKLGRLDSRTASQSAANNDIPQPTMDIKSLISNFKAVGLSSSELVALSGGHTIGLARCTSFRGRIYTESTIDPTFAQMRRSNCPRTNGTGDNNLAPLDYQTPTCFDNDYFKNIVNQKGLLHSDQQLLSSGLTRALVQTYSENPSKFSSDFAAAMVKMGDIKPLTGSSGEIRKNCRKVN